MLFAIISFLGLIIGLILSRKFKTELKDINKFLKVIIFITLISIILKLAFLASFNLLFFIGLLIGILITYFVKNNYLHFGFILMLSNFISDMNKIFFSVLIFIIGIIYPALINVSIKRIILSLVLFALPFILLLINISYNNFIIGFSIGGLIIGIKQYYK
jgi:hypothetical protein